MEDTYSLLELAKDLFDDEENKALDRFMDIYAGKDGSLIDGIKRAVEVFNYRRDWFAAAALSGMIANKCTPMSYDGNSLAEMAVRQADAMLIALDEQPEKASVSERVEASMERIRAERALASGKEKE